MQFGRACHDSSCFWCCACWLATVAIGNREDTHTTRDKAIIMHLFFRWRCILNSFILCVHQITRESEAMRPLHKLTPCYRSRKACYYYFTHIATNENANDGTKQIASSIEHVASHSHHDSAHSNVILIFDVLSSVAIRTIWWCVVVVVVVDFAHCF